MHLPNYQYVSNAWIQVLLIIICEIMFFMTLEVFVTKYGFSFSFYSVLVLHRLITIARVYST